MLGKLLAGKYQILRLLGEGGMGAVYEAQHTAIGRRVAVKTIRHSRLEQPATLERFRREAFAMAAVESDHVATILDAGDDPESGSAYLVMELLAGNDLAHVLSRVGPLLPQTALRIVHQALEGLRAAHIAGIAHRDIKPSNLFIARRPDGSIVVKLVDFGIARNLAEGNAPAAKKVTESGVVLGSPLYMSPEQFSASPELDFRTDLWSLGVVLFEMVAGENPYVKAADLPQMLAMICMLPPPSVREAAPWVPEEVAAIVSRAMRQKPAERYASADQMLADVARAMDGSPELEQGMFARMSSTDKVAVPEQSAREQSGRGTVPMSAFAMMNARPEGSGRTAPMPPSAMMSALAASAFPAASAVPATRAMPAAPRPQGSAARGAGGSMVRLAVGGGLALAGIAAGAYMLVSRSGASRPPEASPVIAPLAPSVEVTPAPTTSGSAAAPAVAAPSVNTAGGAGTPASASAAAPSMTASSAPFKGSSAPKGSAAPKLADDPFGKSRKGK